MVNIKGLFGNLKGQQYLDMYNPSGFLYLCSFYDSIIPGCHNISSFVCTYLNQSNYKYRIYYSFFPSFLSSLINLISCQWKSINAMKIQQILRHAQQFIYTKTKNTLNLRQSFFNANSLYICHILDCLFYLNK